MSLCLCCICSCLWPFFLVREGSTPHMTTFTHDLGPLSTLSIKPLSKPLCDLLTPTPPYASVQFSCSVVSNSLQPHGLQHARLFPVHHQLLEFTQTHVHWVSDAIKPSHPLLPPSPLALNLSQHQGLFQWVSSLYQVAKVLEFQLQHQSFQWTPRTYLL